MHGVMAEIAKQFSDPGQCTKTNKLIHSTANAPASPGITLDPSVMAPEYLRIKALAKKQCHTDELNLMAE